MSVIEAVNAVLSVFPERWPIPLPAATAIFVALSLAIKGWVAFDMAKDVVTNNEYIRFPGRTCSDNSFDYIVVGAGAAGMVVATRVANASATATVLLLEAGGEPSLLNELPSLGLFLVNQPANTFVYKSTPQQYSCGHCDHRKSLTTRGKMMGGSTSTNFMMWVRGHREDYNRWSTEDTAGDPQWTYQNLLQYFRKSEDYNGLYKSVPDSNTFHGRGGLLNIATYDYQPGLLDFLTAAREKGYPIGDYNAAEQAVFSPIDVTTQDGWRESTYRAFYRDTGKPTNLCIRKYAHVVRVNFDGQINGGNPRAAGVTYIRHKKFVHVYARREVILSAGAIGTPKLLLLSGVGPREELEAINIPVIRDLPVGRNLQDHAYTIVGPFLKSPSLNPNRDITVQASAQFLLNGGGAIAAPVGLAGLGFLRSPLAQPSYPDIEVVQMSLALYPELPRDLHRFLGISEKILYKWFDPYHLKNTDARFLLLSLGRPKSVGYLRLASTSPFDNPIMDPMYLQHPDDIEALLFGFKTMVDIFENTTALNTLMFSKPVPGCENHVFKSDPYYRCVIRHFSGSFYGHVGTCGLGRVVDNNLRVRGVNGLRVIDASVIPRTPNANIQAGTIMLAEKGADLIVFGDGYLGPNDTRSNGVPGAAVGVGINFDPRLNGYKGGGGFFFNPTPPVAPPPSIPISPVQPPPVPPPSPTGSIPVSPVQWQWQWQWPQNQSFYFGQNQSLYFNQWPNGYKGGGGYYFVPPPPGVLPPPSIPISPVQPPPTSPPAPSSSIPISPVQPPPNQSVNYDPLLDGYKGGGGYFFNPPPPGAPPSSIPISPGQPSPNQSINFDPRLNGYHGGGGYFFNPPPPGAPPSSIPTSPVQPPPAPPLSPNSSIPVSAEQPPPSSSTSPVQPPPIQSVYYDPRLNGYKGGGGYSFVPPAPAAPPPSIPISPQQPPTQTPPDFDPRLNGYQGGGGFFFNPPVPATPPSSIPISPDQPQSPPIPPPSPSSSIPISPEQPPQVPPPSSSIPISPGPSSQVPPPAPTSSIPISPQQPQPPVRSPIPPQLIRGFNTTQSPVLPPFVPFPYKFHPLYPPPSPIYTPRNQSRIPLPSIPPPTPVPSSQSPVPSPTPDFTPGFYKFSPLYPTPPPISDQRNQSRIVLPTSPPSPTLQTFAPVSYQFQPLFPTPSPSNRVTPRLNRSSLPPSPPPSAPVSYQFQPLFPAPPPSIPIFDQQNQSRITLPSMPSVRPSVPPPPTPRTSAPVSYNFQPLFSTLPPNTSFTPNRQRTSLPPAQSASTSAPVSYNFQPLFSTSSPVTPNRQRSSIPPSQPPSPSVSYQFQPLFSTTSPDNTFTPNRTRPSVPLPPLSPIPSVPVAYNFQPLFSTASPSDPVVTPNRQRSSEPPNSSPPPPLPASYSFQPLFSTPPPSNTSVISNRRRSSTPFPPPSGSVSYTFQPLFSTSDRKSVV